MAVANYAEAHNGQFPPAFQLGPDGRPWHSWRVLILPYIEQDNLFKAYRFNEPWDGPNNRRLAEPMPRTYGFSVRNNPTTTTNYLAVVGAETMWPGANSRNRGEINASNTVLLVENDGLGVHWMEPRDLAFSDMSFEIQNPNGVSSPYNGPAAAMADTSVRSLNADITPDELRAMIVGGRTEGDWKILEDGRDRPLK